MYAFIHLNSHHSIPPPNPNPPMKTPIPTMHVRKFTLHLHNLPLLLFSIITTINHSIVARPLPDTDHCVITFFINNVLPQKSTSMLTSAIGKGREMIFPQPNGPSNSTGLINVASVGFSVPARQNAPIGWLSFLTNVQAMEIGNVTMIEEELTGSMIGLPPLMGKMQGIYVQISEDSSNTNNSHMVAMRAIIGGSKSLDSLRFFGEHRPGRSESHIAVVGGTGRYHGANGFAVVKTTMKRLQFTVHIVTMI